MINILFIHHAVGWGGAPNSMIKLINAIDKNQFNCHVLLIKDSIISNKLKEHNIEYTIARSFFYRKIYKYFSHTENKNSKKITILKWIELSILWLLSREYFAIKEIEKFECDIIHLNSSVLTDWLKPCSKKAKVIMHVRESVSKGNFGIRYSLFRQQMDLYADHIIAISKDTADRLGLIKHTTVIYNYTEPTNRTIDSRSYYSKKVLYVGGQTEIKGFYTLVDSLSFIDEDIEVYFAGTYQSKILTTRKKIKKMLNINGGGEKKLKVMRSNKQAIEIGMIKEIFPVLNQVCCMVSPFSCPHFSRPIIEAFSMKKAVIGTNMHATTEIVSNGVNGIIVEIDNPRELAKAINYLCTNPEISKEMGRYGFLEYKKRFTDKNANNVEKVYQKLFNEK